MSRSRGAEPAPSAILRQPCRVRRSIRSMRCSLLGNDLRLRLDLGDRLRLAARRRIAPAQRRAAPASPGPARTTGVRLRPRDASLRKAAISLRPLERAMEKSHSDQARNERYNTQSPPTSQPASRRNRRIIDPSAPPGAGQDRVHGAIPHDEKTNRSWNCRCSRHPCADQNAAQIARSTCRTLS